MVRHLVRAVLVLVALLAVAACASRLKADDARAALTAQLRLDASRLTVRSVNEDALPLATIDYGGVAATVRFRRENGAWTVDALRDGEQWMAAAGRLPALAAHLETRARAKFLEQSMPRYASTLQLLVGWTNLLVQECSSGYPASPKALLGLHASWHRVLFAKRGGEFHNPDLFQRDGWWKPFRIKLSVDRVSVQSPGADGQLDTADDMDLVAERQLLAGGAHACWPHYRLPAFVIDALRAADAPQAWRQATLITTLEAAEQLAVWEGKGK